MWCSVNGLKAVVPILVFVTACGVSDDNADTAPDSDSGPEILEDAEHVRMMTFNLRTPFADEGDRLWENRKEAVVAQIETLLDIMVVQAPCRPTVGRPRSRFRDSTGSAWTTRNRVLRRIYGHLFDHSSRVLDWKTFALRDAGRPAEPDQRRTEVSRAAIWGASSASPTGSSSTLSRHRDHAGSMVSVRKWRASPSSDDILTEGRPALIARTSTAPPTRSLQHHGWEG